MVHDIVSKRHMGEDEGKKLPQVFSVGDLWPPSIIMSEDSVNLGIIDWEFAGFAAPMQDMAQLCE